jgi:hypothetical protein
VANIGSERMLTVLMPKHNAISLLPRERKRLMIVPWFTVISQASHYSAPIKFCQEWQKWSKACSKEGRPS